MSRIQKYLFASLLQPADTYIIIMAALDSTDSLRI